MSTTDKPKAKRPRAPRAVRSPEGPQSPSLQPPTSNVSATPNQPTASNPPIAETPVDKTKAQWDNDDNAIFIEALTAERQPANGAIGPQNATTAHGFKGATWTEVENKLKGTERKKIPGTNLVTVSGLKTVKACKTHWYALSKLYTDYKHLNGLSGAGWKDGCIDLPDAVWAPILADKKSAKAKDYARLKGRPFPLFDAIGTLVEGHKATGKYVTGSIKPAVPSTPIIDKAPVPSTPIIDKAPVASTPIIDKPDMASTSTSPIVNTTKVPSPFADQANDPFNRGFSSSPPGHHPSPKSPPSDDSHEANFKPKDDSDSDEPSAAKRHRKSKVALAARAPTKSKKRSGIQILDGMSTDMKEFGSNIQTSFASTSASIDNAANTIQADKPSTHASAVALIYKSSLANTQRYIALDLFIEKPLIAETYLNTPARERDGWLQYIINKKN